MTTEANMLPETNAVNNSLGLWFYYLSKVSQVEEASKGPYSMKFI